MNPPENFHKIINRKRYSTATATLLTGNDFWDGHNFERSGTNTWLYKTPNGAYFKLTLTQWQGAQDTLEPISMEEAILLYEGSLTEHRVSYQEAFPNVTVEEA